MKNITWIVITLFMLSVVAVILADSKITQDVIKIDTPKKKKDEKGTEVVFQHKKHSDEYAKACDKCHPPLKEVVDAPENDKTAVHANCKTCHNKDKPAKTFRCGTCHMPKEGA